MDQRKLKLQRSINNLSKKLSRFDFSDGKGNSSNGNEGSNSPYYWKGKRIIPLKEWVKLKSTC